MAVHTEAVDVVCKTWPPEDHRNIPVINQPNPCYGYNITAEELWYLIRLSNYYIYEAGTETIIDGDNYYDYFPEKGGGGGGGGGVTPQQVQTMIDEALAPVDERIDKVEDEIDTLENEILVYEKGEEIKVGKLAYLTPGQLYQATVTFTANNDPSLTTQEALEADIDAGNLAPITDTEVAILEGRVDALENWKPIVDEDIANLKIAVVEAEETEYYSNINSFPEEGESDITYVDKSTGKSYIWNTNTSAYELMNTNNIIDGSIFNSTL